MPKLPVLMYHSVSKDTSNSKGLTISKERLESQFKFLKENGYTTLHFKDLQALKGPSDYPEKAVIITFDDVYVNQLELAYPLLQQYGLKASFYIPFQYVGGTDDWNDGTEPIMSVTQLQSLNTNVIELGLHSFAHGNYNEMSVEDIQEDFDKCKAFIVEHNLEIHNTLAYPYGKFPRKGEEQLAFFNTLHNNRVAYGLRIGNRVNTFPFKNNYEVQRIDIKGEDSIATFKKKLKRGKGWF